VPNISVVIVNYNGRRWLADCLDALAAQTDAPPFETIVVDNASGDGSVEIARGRSPTIQVVALDRNLGFAAGNNAGAARAAGEWIAFLNNDTVPAPDWVARLSAAAETHPAFALFTSRIVFMHDRAQIDSAGDGYFLAGGAFKHGHGAAAAGYAASGEVFGACGGAFMIGARTFGDLGGFDESFFMVYEDVDLSYRARLQGLRVWYAADAVVAHAGSASSGVQSPLTVFHGQRNLEWTWLKNTPARLLTMTALSHVVYSVAGVLHYVRAGRGAAALRGKLAALAGVPAILRARRGVQAASRVTPVEVAALMERRWLARKRREKAFDTARAAPRA
jgi:GT2 family glycosyltransferase